MSDLVVLCDWLRTRMIVYTQGHTATTVDLATARACIAALTAPFKAAATSIPAFTARRYNNRVHQQAATTAAGATAATAADSTTT